MTSAVGTYLQRVREAIAALREDEIERAICCGRRTGRVGRSSSSGTAAAPPPLLMWPRTCRNPSRSAAASPCTSLALRQRFLSWRARGVHGLLESLAELLVGVHE